MSDGSSSLQISVVSIDFDKWKSHPDKISSPTQTRLVMTTTQLNEKIWILQCAIVKFLETVIEGSVFHP